MSNKNNKSDESAQDLAKVIQSGTATEQEAGAALKAIQVSLASTMAGGLQTMFTPMTTLNAMVVQALDRLQVRWETERDTMNFASLVEFIDTVQNRQVQMLDLFRKTVQGKELINGTTLSEEERMVLKLFKSFKTPAEKAKFLDLCRSQLNEES